MRKKFIWHSITKSLMVMAVLLSALIPGKAEALTVSYNNSFKTIGVVDVSGGNLNIRKSATTSSSVVGSFKNHAGAKIKKTVHKDDGDWYQIKSGDVTGYAKASYLLKGSAGSAAAKEYGSIVYKVGVDSLRMRKSPTTSSDCVKVLSEGKKVTLVNSKVKKADGYSWVKVKATYSGTTYKGYVAKEYLDKYITLKNATKVSSSSGSSASSSSSSSSSSSTSNSSASASSSSSSTSTAGLGSKIVSSAKSYVGKLNYVYGGTSLTTGADCSGFTQSIYSMHGVSIPRTAASQAANGKSISRSDLRLGDLVFYGSSDSISHVAIYIGDGRIVHCANESRDCVIDDMDYMTVRKCATYIH